MTTIIHATPWGVCRRYYDDRGDLLYSQYDRVLPRIASIQPRSSMEGGAGSARAVHATSRGAGVTEKKKIAPIVEFSPACSTCA